MELELSVGKLTDVGATRDHNEDCFAIHEPVYPQEWSVKGRLYVVADGMGGHAAGEVASRYAVDRLVQLYFSSAYEGDLRWRLAECVRQINRELHQQASEKKGRARMGTTLVCAVVRADMLYVANVGDSRAYLIRGGTIRPLTRDHSLVAEFIEAGTLAPEDADKHPQRSVLTRALGTKPQVEVDTFEERLQRGDAVVLCSDGLWGEVPDEEIKAMATRGSPQTAVQQLVESANERGGADNITIVVLRVGEPAAPTLRVAPVAEAQRPGRQIGLIVAALGVAVLLVLLSLGAFVLLRRFLVAALPVERALITPTPSVPAPTTPPATTEPTAPAVASTARTQEPAPTPSPTPPPMPTIPTSTPTLSSETAAPATPPPPTKPGGPTEAPAVAVLPTAPPTPSLTPLVLLPTSTSTPTPLALAYQAPLLQRPLDGTVFEGPPEEEIHLQWASVGRLTPDEYYEVTVTYQEGGEERSWQGKTRDSSLWLSWMLGPRRADRDLFYWSMVVRRRSGGTAQEHQAVSPRSEVREFTWRVLSPTATASRTPTLTLTPTSAPKLPTPTFTPTSAPRLRLHTLTPTSAPTWPIPTATIELTLEPTVEITPTFAITLPALPSPAPVLLGPAEDFRTDGSSIILKWKWSRELDEGEYFDIQIRPRWQTDSVFVDWTRELTYELKKWSTWQPHEYTWTIAVIRGHYDSDGKKVLEKNLGLVSEARLFRWDAGGAEKEEGGSQEAPHPEPGPES